MSVFITELLARFPDTDVTAVDVAPLDAAAKAHFAGVMDRMTVRQCDVRDAAALREIVVAARPDVVVHGATVTHVPSWEYERPHLFVDVNVSGTLNLLEAVRAAGTARRVVHVSSCAVYGRREPATGSEGLQAEEGPFHPADLYGIGKLGGEQVARRFSELHPLAIPIARFTRVFGPMERPTGYRKAMHLPHLLVAGMLAGRPVRITRRSATSVGDFVSSEDVADALIRLCDGAAPAGTYNVATGQPITVADLVRLIPAEVEWVDDDTEFDADYDPSLRNGQRAVYDVSRIALDIGWVARPFEAQVASYVAWAKANPAVFIP
jgi:nucleoside-diphosphate-sugar epimerase